MPRSQAALVGALLLVGIGLFVWRANKRSHAAEEPHGTPSVSAPASAPGPSLSSPSGPVEPVASNVLPDGQKVPELPADAPKRVSFGVVLVTYRGAEGAPSDARTREAALAKAKELVADAQRDFAEAVKKGDPGSNAEAGSMPQGVLEPNLEYILFTLKKGEVYKEPVDTARGYWLLRRTQ